MLKFIKHNMTTIDGIEIYPLIAFAIFFLFFIGIMVWVFSTDKKTIDHLKNLPLDDSSINTTNITNNITNNITTNMTNQNK